jgi:2-methylisocitrate lyase-like PEP mutase family enzyme
MSARVFVAAGFEAIATANWGVAWSLGLCRWRTRSSGEIIVAKARIVRVARVPVTAGIEASCGYSPDGPRFFADLASNRSQDAMR